MLGEAARALLLTPLALLPPGWAVARHLGRGMRPTERFLVGLALAPLGLAAPALALALGAGIPASTCFWLSELIALTVALWPVGLRPAPADTEPLPERGHGFPGLAALATALGLAVLIAIPPLLIPYARTWSDAWFHSAAAIEIARRGVPPQDPYFAGIPFYYSWIPHFLLALLAEPTRASPFHLQAMMNVWAAAVMSLSAAHLAHRVFGRSAAAWAGAVAVLGLNPLGWLFCLVRGMTGETRGLEAIVGYLTGMNGAAGSLTMGFPWLHSSMLNRLWTGTPQTPAMALAIALAWSVLRGLARPGWMGALRTGLIALAALVTHPAYGGPAVVACGGGLLLVAFAGPRRGAAVAGLGTLAAAVALGAPYIRAVAAPGAAEAAAALGFYRPNALSLALAIGPWWIVAAPALLAAAATATATAVATATGRFALGALGSAVMLALLLVLPPPNSEKLFYPVWLLFAPFAAAGAVLWSERFRWRTAHRFVLLALVVPSAALFTAGVMLERRSPGVLVRGEQPHTMLLPLETPPEAVAYHFLRQDTPLEAVILESPRPTVNEPVPVLGERRVFTGPLEVYLGVYHHPGERLDPKLQALLDEVEIRREIQRALYAGEELRPAQRQYLTHFEYPIYLMLRRGELDAATWGGFRGAEDWREVFGNDQVRLYRRVTTQRAQP